MATIPAIGMENLEIVKNFPNPETEHNVHKIKKHIDCSCVYFLHCIVPYLLLWAFVDSHAVLIHVSILFP